MPQSPATRRVLSIYEGVSTGRATGQSPQVAVIGAGLAGLCAAYILARAGVQATIFEAASRVGGRVRTDHGQQEHGLVSELGGEFIDTQHSDMMALAQHFRLPLIDTGQASEDSLATAFHFDGRHYSETEVLAAYGEVAPRIAQDVARLSTRVSRRRHTDVDRWFDHLSISEYLTTLAMPSWLSKLIEVAFVTVYGGEAGEQSSVNLLSLIGTDTSAGFAIFGSSDERYKIRDGADRITDGLARALGDRVHLEHRLVRLRKQGQAYRLALQTPSRAIEVDADFLVLALPFTLLQQVDVGDTLPAYKRKAINELAYGSNSKLLLGMRQRIWRDQGYEGGIYTDLPFQSAWDGSRLRAGERGIFTCFLGGRQGQELGVGSPQSHASCAVDSAAKVFPGLDAEFTGSVTRAHWPSEPFALGSYTCYRPGQWTSVAGDEVTPVGNVFFAGEHCAKTSQGYMNGAAETGRHAAQAILRRLA